MRLASDVDENKTNVHLVCGFMGFLRKKENGGATQSEEDPTCERIALFSA